MGLNAVYHGFSYLPESREMGMTDELRAVEQKRVKDSGIRIARSYYRPDWAMGDGPWLRPNWESDRMRALYAWLADMQRLGIDVALNMGWWFPRDVIWNRDQHLATYPDDLKAYCQWLSDSVHQMVERRGFTNLKYLVMFTEPSDRFGDAPNGMTNWDYYREVLRSVHQRLVDDGRRDLIKIVGPNAPQSPLWLDKATAELNDVIDIYASHTYNLLTYQEWLAMAQKAKAIVQPTGKPLWIDEYGVQDAGLRRSARYATILAQANAAFLKAGAQSSFLWLLEDQYYPQPIKYLTNNDSFVDGKHGWGLLPWPAEGQAPRPAWPAFAMLARLLGEAGSRAIRTSGPDDLPAAATLGPDGRLNLLLVNPGPRRRELTVSFSKPLAQPLFRYAFQPEAKPSATSRRLEAAAKQEINASLAPDEVVILSSRPPKPDDPWSKDAGPADQEGDGNLALHKEVLVASADPDWPAANLTDGQRLTAWRPAKGKAGGRKGQEATVDLGAKYTVRQVEVFEAADGERPAGGKARIGVSLSLDRKHWQRVPVQDRRPDAAAVLILPLPPRSSARYVRVEVEPQSTGRRPGPQALPVGLLSEIKVFGQ